MNRKQSADQLTDLILEIFRVNGRLLEVGDDLVAPLGITSARWQVLGAIATSAAPLSVAQVARNMGLARQSVQRLVNEMTGQGLVCLETNPHHQRAKLVTLTEAGRRVFEGAMRRQGRWASKLAQSLGAIDFESTVTVMRRLRDQLEAE
jgi:DNA-binding MarR family transcriptional regulator